MVGNLNDTQLIILVVAVLVVIFVLGGCQLKCNAFEGYTGRHWTGPDTAYPGKGGNLLQGSVIANRHRVGDMVCHNCLAATGEDVDKSMRCGRCQDSGMCDPGDCTRRSN